MSVRWISAWFSKCIIQSWSSLYSFVAVCSSFANRFCLKKKGILYMNTCWAPHLEMSPKCFTMATIQWYSLSLHSSHMQLWMSNCSFTQHVLEYPPKWLQRCLVVIWLVSHETADVLTQVLCTPYNHAPVCSDSIRRMHVCLAAACHPHFFTCYCNNKGVECILK